MGWILTENCMAVLLSTKLNLSDVISHIQAGLKSTVSAVELIDSNQPHTQEITIQRNRRSNTVLSYILHENPEKLPNVELFYLS